MTSAEKVNYDFAAAQQLSQMLTQLSTKLNDLNSLRQKLGTSHLDARGQEWTGKRRDEFNRAITKQRQALVVLAGQARRLQGAVDHATTEASARVRDMHRRQ
ncbi:hypothetical protein ABZ915_37285 [Streptomyces sp. NPDC046915]|uniref:hypothetical protein n=1 Tax=Streptomyces sp. NPDC046915 TaxID=3155257 RepID=UPI00340891AE